VKTLINVLILLLVTVGIHADGINRRSFFLYSSVPPVCIVSTSLSNSLLTTILSTPATSAISSTHGSYAPLMSISTLTSSTGAYSWYGTTATAIEVTTGAQIKLGLHDNHVVFDQEFFVTSFWGDWTHCMWYAR